MKIVNRIFTSSLLLLGSSQVLAGYIDWTDWTASDSATYATGTVGGVSIDYTGTLSFSQLGTGTNYWTEYSPAPYTGNAVVDNAPTAAEMLALNLASNNTITFGQTVLNPLMAIVSQGQAPQPVTYDFDTAFTVLSEGHGYWGDGTYTLGAGDQLTGVELHGVIQFHGAVNSISWTSTQENWHGFTFGLVENATDVPEPGGLILLTLGLLGLVKRSRGWTA